MNIENRDYIGNKDKWICPICNDSEDNKPNNQDIPICVKDYLNGINEIFTSRSIWSIYENMKYIVNVPNIIYPLEYSGKVVLNIEELKSTVDNFIALEKAELGVCMICFTEMNKRDLHDVCDLKNCNTKGCFECLSNWYGEAKVGNILPIANLKCGFCRKPPTSKILKKYNKELCTLKVFDHKNVDHNWYYAWCIKCYTGKKYIEKICSENIPIVRTFTCEDCNVITGKDIICKACPQCGVLVEKTSGCDHITCSCGSHWCFSCQELSTKDKIYDHMWTKHGSIGLVANNDYDSDYDSDDEY
jgi:rubrerythrin